MSDVVDLDALAPPSVTIKINDQLVEVPPPTTGDIFRLGSLGNKLVESGALKDEELSAVVTDITALVKKCIPQLADVSLNTAQLLKVIEVLNEMAMPPDSKELEKRGISTSDPKAE